MFNARKYLKMKDFETIVGEFPSDNQTSFERANSYESPMKDQVMAMDEDGNVYNSKTNEIYYNIND